MAIVVAQTANINITSQSQNRFVEVMNQQVTKLLSTKLNGDFSMFNFPSGFYWGIQFGPNNYYNPKSLNQIDFITHLEDSAIQWGEENFSNLYNQIINSVAYTISTADMDIINNEALSAASQISSVINEWETAFGEITDEDRQKATPPSKLGYIEEQVQSRWGGDVRKIPSSLSDFKRAYQTYQVKAAKSTVILGRSGQAMLQLEAARNNTEIATKENGGMRTGESSYYVAFTGIPAQTSINSQLQTSSNKISLGFSVSSFSSTECNLSIAGGASARIPIGDFVSISIEGSAKYDLSKYTSSSSSLEVTITYPGITAIGSAPANLSKERTSGWYDNNMLSEAVKNADKGDEATGFQLTGSEFPVADYFGEGKKFSRVKTLVICQQPTISMKFKNANSSTVISDFKEKSRIKVSVLGLFDIGSSSESYEIQKIDSKSSTGEITITLGPPKPIGTTPSQDTTAYVLGGVVSYPPNY